jgi:hypothetical protein
VKVKVILIDVFLDEMFLNGLGEASGLGSVVVVDMPDDEEQFVVVHVVNVERHCRDSRL